MLPSPLVVDIYFVYSVLLCAFRPPLVRLLTLVCFSDVRGFGSVLFTAWLAVCAQRDDVGRSAQFIIHAALDMVDVKQWTSPVTYVALHVPFCCAESQLPNAHHHAV